MGQHSGNGDVPAGPLGPQSPSQQQAQQDLSNVTDDASAHAAQTHNVDVANHITTEQERAQQEAVNAATGGPLAGLMQAAQLAMEVLEPSVQQLAGQQAHLMAAPGPPGINYPGMTHVQLHDSVQKQADPGAVDGLGQMWVKRANHMTELQNDLVKGIAASEDGWRGHDAEQARQSVAKMARSAGTFQGGAHLAGQSLQQQSTALSQARTNVPEPPENPYDPVKAEAHLQTLKDDPVAYHKQVQQDAAQQAHEKALHDQAVQGVQTYDHTTAQLAQTQPAFAPPPPGSGGSGGDGGGGATGGFEGSQGGHTSPSSYTGGSGGGGDGHYGGGAGGGGRTAPPPGGGSHLPGGGSTQTGPQTGPGGHRGPIPGPGGPGGSGGPGEGRRGGPSGGMIPGAGGAGAGSGSGTGRGSGRYHGGRGTGAGSEGAGRSGAGRSGAGRAGALGEGGKSANGAGGRSGAGRAGAGAAEEAAMGRGGAGGGRGGRGMGMMPRGGKGGKGEDDYEHNSPSWLIEPDKDTLFGCDQKTAPPVIGNWWGEHDPRKNSNNNQNTDDED